MPVGFPVFDGIGIVEPLAPGTASSEAPVQGAERPRHGLDDHRRARRTDTR